ncbi:MAG TPA: hypothetical protein VLU38_04035 [Methanomassiliicoccales archaeon]|nr:hypothetical protein [Methanomassiliicoccales archaeon]
MISLVLVDAEIERLPLFVQESEKARTNGADDEDLQGIIVLDRALHRYLVEGLEDAGRRGRPDIVHSFLLLTQGSKAIRQGKLSTYIHIRSDEVVFVGNRYRPEHQYIPFLRTFSELLENGNVGKGGRGLRLERSMDLKSLLRRLVPDKIVALTPTGEKRDLAQVLRPSIEGHLAVLVGGFPEGDYHSPVYEMADERISLGDELLTVPDVTSRVLASIP